MAHYALIDKNNIVTYVFVGKNEDEGDLDWEVYYGERNNKLCKRTSVNTYGNQHFQDKEPFRKNYAAIGYIYDSKKDAFYSPQPFNSWTLNEETFLWEPPIEIPDSENPYRWNEETLSWDLVTE